MLITRGLGISDIGETTLLHAPLEIALPPKISLIGELVEVDTMEGTFTRITPLNVELPEE